MPLLNVSVKTEPETSIPQKAVTVSHRAAPHAAALCGSCGGRRFLLPQ